MREKRPGQSFVASIDGAPSGLVGTIAVRILAVPAGTVTLARTTAGIQELPAGSGIYEAALVAPAIEGAYDIVWDSGGGTPIYASEDLDVSADAPATDALTIPAGTTFEVTLDGAPTGLVGTLGVQIIDPPNGTVVVARTTAGIVEAPAGSGIYAVELTAPATAGDYAVVWDTGGGAPIFTAEQFVATPNAAIPPAPIGRTFKDLQDESLADDFSSSKYRERVKQWLNAAERKVFRRARVAEGEATQDLTLVTGQTYAYLDNLVIRPNSIRLTSDGSELVEAAIEDLDSSPVSSGRPRLFALSGRRVVFYPTPDASYAIEIRYQGRPGTMVADSDRATIHPDYDDLLVSWARSRLFRAEDDTEMATFYMGEFEAELARMRSDVARRSRGRRRQVPGMFAGDPPPSFARPTR